jgi:hypothetical protein
METPALKPSRIKKNFRRAFFVLAVLVTLGALFVAEEDWRGGRAWRNYKSAMEAKGERFDAARLIPPKVPDEENFAACAYLAHAFAGPLESPGWTNVESYLRYPDSLPRRQGWPYGLSADLSNWVVSFQSVSESSVSTASRRISENTIGIIRHNAQAERQRHGLQAAAATNSQTRSEGGAVAKNMEPAQAAAIILDHLKVCEPVLTELQAASLRRYCRFNVPYEELAGPTISNAMVLTMNHYIVIKWLDRVLSLRAEAELAAGQSDSALEDVHLMLRLDDGLKDEPLLISQLVHYACMTLILHPIAQGLAERRWSDAQLRALQEQLGQTDLLASTVRAFYGERDILAKNSFFSGSRFVPRGWSCWEELNLNRAFQEALLPRVNIAEREIKPDTGHACDIAMSNYPTSGAFIHHRIFATMMLPPLFRAPQQAAFAQTEIDLLSVACALERYRLAEGSYPEQLASLTPRFIATLPHDIVNGQPLNYRRTANGKFVLYSVGWNEKDDGGVTTTKKDGSPDRDRGDWVLEYPN